MQIGNISNKVLDYDENIIILKEELENITNKINSLESKGKYILYDTDYVNISEFIFDDKTNENTYDDDKYNCAHFSRDVNNNAEEKGLRCAYVIAFFDTGYPHALVAFSTTDKGLVFFEPQTDEKVELEIGKDYWTECVISDQSYESIGIIVSYTLHW